ncbi:Permease, major facilitator superfamily [Neochlamydia sp. TUME1]|uniref:MFS transporter n=1 Tax=Neochlamydia sp. TUME1 TaxID=1478174 RepID=UPI0005832A74|nr:MFS transporter [Neochlamydia sp. TUME1]KIC71801.1 Permease, major facilitator superfamily [Neochlamydia sp. TUME1]
MTFFMIRPLIFIWLAHFLVDFMIGIWAMYKTLAHLDLFLAGTISAAGAFFGEGMQIFFGPLSDRGWRKQLICLGILFTAANTFLAYSTNYWILLLIYSITCVGSGAFHPAATSLAGTLTPHRKAMIIAIFASGGALGLASSQIIYTYFHSVLHGATAILILPAILLVLTSFYGLHGIQSFTPIHSAHEVNLKALFRMFKNRNLRLLYIAQVCNQTLFWATIFLLPDTLICKGYNAWICHGGGHLFLILGGAVMMIPAGYISDRYSPKRVILWATVAAMIAFYIFLLYPTFDNITFVALIFLLGAFFATVNSVLIAFGHLLVPESPGMVSAFLMGMAWCISEGLGQGGGGLMTRFFNEHAPVYALSILGIFFIIGIMATLWLPDLEKNEIKGQLN